MPSCSRRVLLARIAQIATAQAFSRTPLVQAQSSHLPPKGMKNGVLDLSVSVKWDNVVSCIPTDMLGLSYEASQLSVPDFFSSANTDLIALFRGISTHGVLRLGGNLSEYTEWTPDLQQIPVTPFRAVGADPSSGGAIPRAQISKLAIQNLRDFLDQTGWKAIYGVNLAQSHTSSVVEEARYVARMLGPKLIAFQIGNEPDHYIMNQLRKPGYTFDDYFSEWRKVHDAIFAAVPQAHFAGPDVAQDLSWIQAFARKAPKSVTMLTGHHYAEGPPSDPDMTIQKLLAPDQDLVRRTASIKEICEQNHLPYVMAETNSCYKAGKEGVSDVFASALWALDYILQLALAGQVGIYFHGGANGWYTPIAGGSGKPFTPRPIYYGLQMAGELLNSEMVPVDCAACSPEVSIYALRSPQRLVVVNKGARDARVHLGETVSSIRGRYLQAPSLDARSGIVLFAESLLHASMLSVPAYSAAIFELRLA